jgi:hypothetical protein
MLATLFLSVDSMFAGAVLRFLGTRRVHLGLACWAMGLADFIALLLGRALHKPIAIHMDTLEQRMLFAGCALAPMLLGEATAYFPRTAIAAIAVLFSIDNLLAGVGMSSFGSAALVACAVGIFSAIACRAGFECADAVAVRVRPRISVVLASVLVATSFLHL